MKELNDILKNKGISRRNMLKCMTAVAATAAIGCNKEEDAEYSWVDAPITEGEVRFDKDVKTVFSTGPHNCGGRCMHKLYVKNDRIIGLTSAGDISRKDCFKADENTGNVGDPIQRRACVRGYGYVQRVYQPDRLKYPLLQTGTKGDLTTFKRISWDEAIDFITDKIKAAYDRKATLGYTPIIGRWFFPGFIENKMSPTIVNYFGNESTGSQDAAKYDSVGINAFTNNVSDMLNSKFILIWGLDPSRSTYWKEHAHWFTTKSKEKNIPIVVISPTCSDTAAVLSTGTSVQVKDGSTVKIPGWVPIRPATDGLLAETMAYIIWKDGLITAENRKFLEDKCFGFSKKPEHLTVTSTAPDKLIADYQNHMVVKPKNITKPADYTDFDPNTGAVNQQPYTGETFTVSESETFEYHLEQLETTRGGSRESVLAYAAKITGIPTSIIEALAYKYGSCNTDDNPALLDVGGGPQRAWNGMEWSWLCICLTAMTGNMKRSGGGAGFSMTGFSDKLAFDQQNYMYVPDPGFMLNAAEVANSIQVQTGHLGHLLMTGKDRRSWEKFKEGVKITTSGYYDPTAIAASPRQDGVNLNAYMGVDLSSPMEVDVVYVRNGNILTTTENINKTVLAFKEQNRTIIVIDQHMTPTAAFADIVLPACSHLETSAIGMPNGSNAMAAIFPMGQAINPLWDSKPDSIIETMILKKLIDKIGAPYSPADLPGAPLSSQVVYAMAQPSALYKAKVDTENKVQMKPYADVVKDGVMELVVPPSKPIIGMKDFYDVDSSNLQTSTGRVNFYSPLWGQLRPKSTYTSKVFIEDENGNREITDFFDTDDVNWRVDGVRNATAKYQPLFNGFEAFKNKNGTPTFTSKISGRDYTLQYITNKSRHRAHTILSNSAVMEDNFKQRLKMNPIDAEKRGNIKTGDLVYVYNDRGCMKIEAEVTDYIIPGAISIEHGSWYRAHPTEECSVWLDTKDDTDNNLTFVKHRVPVDVGGADNILTYDVAGAEQYIGQAVSAQGGPCEVSKIKPE